jgi:hypothetical protein
MRNEMIGAVVRRAMEHPEFRRKLVDNPKEALAAHGFALDEPDMAELERQLVSIAEQYGVHPRTE